MANVVSLAERRSKREAEKFLKLVKEWTSQVDVYLAAGVLTKAQKMQAIEVAEKVLADIRAELAQRGVTRG